MRDIVAETLHNVVDPLVYDEAVSLIEEHHLAGRDVVIVSASGAEVVEPIGEMLGADRVVATRMQVVDGRYTGEIDYYAYGENKAAAMRRLAEEHDYDLARSYAYSDSITDLPMLEAVGHPYAVNPDRELRRQAAARGWPVLRVHPAGRAAQPDAAAAEQAHAGRAGPRDGRRGGRRGVRRGASAARPRHARTAAQTRDPRQVALVTAPGQRRTKENTTQDPHMSQVPTRRTTLPNGRCPSGHTGATVSDARLVAIGLMCQRRHLVSSGRGCRLHDARSARERARLGALGVGLGGVQQPGVHAAGPPSR